MFVRTTGAGHALVLLDLFTGVSRELHRLPQRTYLTSPSFSPDGRQIVAALVDRVSFRGGMPADDVVGSAIRVNAAVPA